jgi:hypothetical protein
MTAAAASENVSEKWPQNNGEMAAKPAGGGGVMSLKSSKSHLNGISGGMAARWRNMQ